jgi:hypothetical protein
VIPEARGYADSWMERAPRSNDPAYRRGFEDGTADRTKAAFHPKVSTDRRKGSRGKAHSRYAGSDSERLVQVVRLLDKAS